MRKLWIPMMFLGWTSAMPPMERAVYALNLSTCIHGSKPGRGTMVLTMQCPALMSVLLDMYLQADLILIPSRIPNL
jgi:hypothetical protein